MHRQVLGITDPKTMVDHKDGDGLDNRRKNLRASTNQQNQANRCKQPHGSSQYKGVRWYAPRSKWSAQIRVDYKNIHLGYFKREEDAARAYNVAAIQHFKEFASVNQL